MALVKAIIVPRPDFQRSDFFDPSRVRELSGNPIEVTLIKEYDRMYYFRIKLGLNMQYSYLLSEEGVHVLEEEDGEVTILWNRGTDTPEFDIIMESPI